MDGNGVCGFPEGSGRQGRVERYRCNVICGAPTNFKVKGLRYTEYKKKRKKSKMLSYLRIRWNFTINSFLYSFLLSSRQITSTGIRSDTINIQKYKI